MHGHLDSADRNCIRGWAIDPEHPDAPVTVVISDNGVIIHRVRADRPRPDLEIVGPGHGRHSFEFNPPGGLSPLTRHLIEARSEADGVALTGSPMTVEPSASFDATAEGDMQTACEAWSGGADGERLLGFLLAQADRLLRQQAGAGIPLGSAPRALVVDDRVPEIGRDPGSAMVMTHMQALQRLGWQVSFAAALEMDRSGPWIDRLGEQFPCWRAPLHPSVEDVLRRHAGSFDLVYLAGLSNASKYLALARHYMPHARVVYGISGVEDFGLAGQEKPTLLAAACLADAVITQSNADANLLRQRVPGAPVHVLPCFRPVRSNPKPFSQRRGIVFFGNYAHPPELDAAEWLVQDIMKLVRSRDPAIECLLVGSDMPASLRRLAAGGRQQPTGVIALGAVADLSAVLGRVRLAVAPLRVGTGFRDAMLDSMAAGVPCVCTRLAVEGMALDAQRWPEALRVPDDTAESIAAVIARWHGDPHEHRRAVQAGIAYIRRELGEHCIDAALAAALGQEARLLQSA